MVQVVHLTAGVIMLVGGPLLEHSPTSNGFVLVVTIALGLFKATSGYFMLSKASDLVLEHSRSESRLSLELWFRTKKLYNVIPVDIFFAFADCIRYIQLVYLANWIDRKGLIIIVGLWFTMVGLIRSIHSCTQSTEFHLIDYLEPE